MAQKNKLEIHLENIENKLGSDSKMPLGTVDPLDWHLTKIESLIGGGGGEDQRLPDPTQGDEGKVATVKSDLSGFEYKEKADLVNGKVPAEQLPSYVDDVLEFNDLSDFPEEGEVGKIYVALDTGFTYRWSGTTYIQIGVQEIPVTDVQVDGESVLDGTVAKITLPNPELIENILWADLKTKKDNAQLVPGKFYRITDYECVVKASCSGANAQSANHVFDIIVFALEANLLSEHAKAVRHAGDTYFQTAKLEAWQLWYCLDNDTSKFEWAVSNGKGVIYRMIDEFDNDAYYDFKNIQFRINSKIDGKGTYNYYYTFDYNNTDASVYTGGRAICYHNKIIPDYNTYSNQWQLNKCVFKIKAAHIVWGAYDNIVGSASTLETFSPACLFKGNHIGEGCSIKWSVSDSTNPYIINNVIGGSTHITIQALSITANYFGSSIDITNDNIASTFASNWIGANNNYITTSGLSNSYIGHDCFKLQLPNNSRDITIQSNIKYVTINATGSTSDALQNIILHSGVCGSSTDYRTLTLERNLGHSVDIYAPDSETIILE